MVKASTPLSYLTVQDMLWVHLQVTQKTHAFRYDLMEEATYYQYAYGQSNQIVVQAARFLVGFSKKKPFGVADTATAFVGFVSFLRLNGHDINLPDHEAAAWVGRITSGAVDAEGAVKSLVTYHDGHLPEPKEAMQSVLDDYPETIAKLRNVA